MPYDEDDTCPWCHKKVWTEREGPHKIMPSQCDNCGGAEFYNSTDGAGLTPLENYQGWYKPGTLWVDACPDENEGLLHAREQAEACWRDNLGAASARALQIGSERELAAQTDLYNQRKDNEKRVQRALARQSYIDDALF